MKIIHSTAKFAAIITITIFTISSCSDDFNTVGGDIVGDPNFDFDLYDETTVVAYSRRTNPVQTNNLPIYQLGVYNDPVYGLTTSNILSQVTLDNLNPSFGENPEIESVILTLPYFSTMHGDATYSLDSIFGNSPIKLSIYESKFYLRDFDPNANFEPQKYYSDQGPQFEGFLGDLLLEIESFKPTNAAIVLNPDTEEEERLSPRLRVELPKQLFEDKILSQQGSDVLLNNSNFKNYFRGLYFKVDAIGPDGNMILLNLDHGSIEIKYSRDGAEPESERVHASIGLSFGGITVNTIEHTFPANIEQSLANPNTSGEDNLYLKGGPGALTIIELFGPDLNNNGVADQLSDLRAKNLIINDAHLIVHVNQDIVSGGNAEPERVYIYDLNNNRILLDYTLDNRTPENVPLNYKTHHLGRLNRDSNGNGVSYKIRLTNHISNLVNKDSTNVRLGLAVSQNVRVTNKQAIKSATSPQPVKIPAASVISPEGTVLHGSNSPNQEKRIKLNIYYTEINN